jgi:hypothetical protein
MCPQTFWLFQTYLHDLASAPNSIAFKTCRRIYNRVQRIVFGTAEPARREKIKENVLPVTVLASLVLAMPDHWPLRRRESRGPSRTSSPTMCRRPRWGGARQSRAGRRGRSSDALPRATQIPRTPAG